MPTDAAARRRGGVPGGVGRSRKQLGNSLITGSPPRIMIRSGRGHAARVVVQTTDTDNKHRAEPPRALTHG
jgi:hypothetical protein